MDSVSKQKRSEIMSRVKSRDSKIESLFRRELWKRGFRYRKSYSRYFGKPDVVLKRHKAVIFVDSCFWHGCSKHCRIPATQKNYWLGKIAGNKKRDKEVTKHYKTEGWKVFRIWEHELRNSKQKVDEIAAQL